MDTQVPAYLLVITLLQLAVVNCSHRFSFPEQPLRRDEARARRSPANVTHTPGADSNDTLDWIKSVIATHNRVSNFTGDKMRETRVVGGHRIPISQQPWVALVETPGFTCGGSFIGKTMVLTAASCIALAEPNDIQVYGKSPYYNTDVRCRHRNRPFITRRVEQIAVHPLFQCFINGDCTMDVGLLKLNKPITISKRLHPISLPADNSELLIDFDRSVNYKDGFSSGWSTRDETCPILRFLKSKIIPIEECQVTYPDVGVITYDDVCATNEDGQMCLFDVGAALVIFVKHDHGNSKSYERPVLVGVMTLKSIPDDCIVGATAYTRITRALNWIREFLENNE